MDLSLNVMNTRMKEYELFIAESLYTKIEKQNIHKNIRNKNQPLKPFYEIEEYCNKIQCGVDEAGRGPLFGRVYAAAVILPKENFDHSIIKDSKRFSSKKKLFQVYEYIKEHAITYSISWEDEKSIDNNNVRKATHKAMHNCIKKIFDSHITNKPELLLIDGCDFTPFTYNDTSLDFVCIEGGDNWYTPIAAASILAKVERDLYIQELCDMYPDLSTKYGIDKNKGYGTKQHMVGIKKYGITQWHRKTFGICKTFV